MPLAILILSVDESFCHVQCFRIQSYPLDGWRIVLVGEHGKMNLWYLFLKAEGKICCALPVQILMTKLDLRGGGFSDPAVVYTNEPIIVLIQPSFFTCMRACRAEY